MKVSLEWLGDFVDIDIPADELADRLTMAGFEVESVERAGGDVDRLLAAKVADSKPHPNADKLKVCSVDTGSRKVDVVCGAPNVEAGQTVVYAPPGTTLPNGMKIEKAAIRGVMSEGMLCSLAELGLEEKSPGIFVFDEQIKPGTPAAGPMGLNDVTIEIGVTPNRPDGLSIVGIAREIAAFLGKPLNKPRVKIEEGSRKAEDLAKVEVQDPAGCPRYVARLIEGVEIKKGPYRIQKRLLACGQRPINNIVDVTNYVMLETGQPLHAFDLHSLAEKRIVVKRAKAGDKFITLDGSERQMAGSDLMICDGRESVAVAGVMGGLHSEVTEKTKDILLESACFDPGSIRATAKRLGMSTEAAYRFERRVDPNLQLDACNRAIAMMAETAGGKIAKGAIDVKTDIPDLQPILLRDERVKLYLGVELPRSETRALLEPLEMEVTEGTDGLTVKPPSFRADMKEEADVIEEVARRYGYDRIVTTLPQSRVQPPAISPEDRLADRIREALTGAGFYEAVNLSFMNPETIDWLKLPAGDVRQRKLPLLNPLSAQEGVLRTSLLPGLLGASAYNLNRFQRDPKLFEIGRVFLSNGPDKLPDEPMEIAGVFCASGGNSLYSTGSHPFYTLKGAVEELLDACKISAEWKPAEDVPYLLPGESAYLVVSKDNLGSAGRLRPSVAGSFGIEEATFVFEIDFKALLGLSFNDVRFRPLPVYPPAFRDIAVIVGDEVAVYDIERAIRRAEEHAVSEIRLFDVYRGKPVPEGKKSVAFSITYRFTDHSPQDKEVNEIHGRIAESLKVEFGALIR